MPNVDLGEYGRGSPGEGACLDMPKLAHGCHSLPYSLGDSSDVASGYQYCSSLFTLVAVSVIIC